MHVVVWCLCHWLIALTCSGLSVGEGWLRHSKVNRSAEVVFVSISVVCVCTYVQTKVHYVSTNDIKATEFYGSILKPWKWLSRQLSACAYSVYQAPSLSCPRYQTSMDVVSLRKNVVKLGANNNLAWAMDRLLAYTFLSTNCSQNTTQKEYYYPIVHYYIFVKFNV